MMRWLAVLVGGAAVLHGAGSGADLPRRGFLGAGLVFVAAPVAGAQVGAVTPGQPAAQLGLQRGDVVTRANDQALDTPTAVAQFARRPPAGGRLELTVRRGRETRQLAGTLPEFPRESYQHADILYSQVTDARGQRLRLTVTRPRSAGARVPAVFIVGWLSDDPVESPPPFQDEISRLFRGLVETSGCALVRVDKPGSGDSDGDAATGDFDTELADYQLAFRAIARFDFLDRERVFVFGLSNGGGFAPLVAGGAPVRGYLVMGGWAKTWFEHMLEIERRIGTLSGKSPGAVNARQVQVAELYTEYLLHGRAPAAIFRDQPALAGLWPDPTPDVLYGRPVAYYQQLQRLNLAEAWSRVAVPTLVMHGEFDWIMSREDHELIAAWVNHNRPGAAELVDLPRTGHGFQTFSSWSRSFAFESDGFDEAHLRRIDDWLARHR